MVEWARRFGCPVLLHADDAEWIMRPDDAIELWEGETRDVGGLELLRLGGHFPGGTVMLAPGGRLLSGDIVQVIPDRGWVGFMYSYPNLIPLPAETVLAMAEKLKPYAFETIQGAWWGTTIRHDAKAIVMRSAERYARALAGDFA
jgi:glyoxylase-like metal-dependent hydrolase (beta-lactamase superfamily II)